VWILKWEGLDHPSNPIPWYWNGIGITFQSQSDTQRLQAVCLTLWYHPKCNQSNPQIGIYWGSDWKWTQYWVLVLDCSTQSQFSNKLGLGWRLIQYQYTVLGPFGDCISFIVAATSQVNIVALDLLSRFAHSSILPPSHVHFTFISINSLSFFSPPLPTGVLKLSSLDWYPVCSNNNLLLSRF
jgi:hypothetical protein